MFQRIVKYYFSDKDYHGIYRSFFCLFITIYCTLISYTHWNILLNELYYISKYTIFTRDIFISYLILDLLYMIVKKQYRMDLLIHHVESLHIYFLFGDSLCCTFILISEIISAFNWINLIDFKYSELNRSLRLLSIVCVRSFVWIFSMYKIYNSDLPFKYYILCNEPLFICLDIYWLSIMYSNIINKLFDNAKIALENTLTKFRSRNNKNKK